MLAHDTNTLDLKSMFKTDMFISEWSSVCLICHVFLQDLDTDIKGKYNTVEDLITQKASGIADAKKRAETLQQEAKDLLLQASDKLQHLKGLSERLFRTSASELLAPLHGQLM